MQDSRRFDRKKTQEAEDHQPVVLSQMDIALESYEGIDDLPIITEVAIVRLVPQDYNLQQG